MVISNRTSLDLLNEEVPFWSHGKWPGWSNDFLGESLWHVQRCIARSWIFFLEVW